MKTSGAPRRLHAVATLTLLLVLGLSAVHVTGASAADPVIGAAGDIACSSSSSNYNNGNGTVDKCRQKYTSDLLVNQGLAAVLPLGDAQYENGTLSGFNSSYNLSWGRLKSITRPAPGNHEYQTTNAAGYFDYFNGTGQATGPAGDRTKGYYSFNVGTWHVIALNSTDHCTIIPCGVGSAQETWLKADLAANANKYCTLAFWHDPRFNSGHDGNADEMAPLFQALYNADADVALGGHAHDYERFAPQNPSGQLDNARGIRQFVVGTGGAFFTALGTTKPNSQVRQNNTYGVLKLTLHPTSYDWQFVSESNKPFTDSGTGQCHGSTPPPPTDTTKPSAPTGLTGSAAEGRVSLNWNASSDNVGVTGYKVYRGGTEIGSVGATTAYTDTTVAGSTTYSYTVRATDAAGNLSDPSNTATVTTPATTSFTIAPEADAEVEVGTPTTNYATGKLRTDGGSTAAESFLRFNVAGLAGSVQSAKLRLFAYTATADGPAVYTVGNTWSETTVNWNTRPLATSAVRDDKGAITTNTWVEWDVTPFVTGNGTYSFGLSQTAADGVDYRSREYTTTTDRPQLVLTVSADSQKPSVPGNLVATGSAGQVALSWQGSTDNVGVTGYRIYRGTTQIATLASTARSYTDTGLGAGTYTYTARAVDAAGNLSDPSNTATGTVPDTTKPTPPGNLTASAGAGQVALSWSASTDNVGVTGYRVFRGTNQIASLGAGATTYTDSPLAPGPYSYAVRAVDAAANLSDPSNSASATVLDTTKPTVPGNLTASAGTGQVALSWNTSSDDVGVAGYRIYRGPDWVASVTSGTTSYTDTGLAAGSYTYTVRAVDAAGNLSDPSNPASATVLDTTKPTVPGNLRATAGTGQVVLRWNASSDDVGVTGYRIYRGGNEIAAVGNTTTYTETNLAPGTYSYTVRARDAAGNLSDPSNSASDTVPDTTQPTKPGNLRATGGTRQVSLTWNASTDNVGVTGYQVYRGPEEIANVGAGATSYTDTGLAAGPYSYTVRAVDAAGNPSDFSDPASATVPDTTPPSAPANLSATPSGHSQVDLTWDDSTDDVIVAGYQVYRNDQYVTTVQDPTYSDVVLPGTYTYVVRAVDGAPNLSAPSNSATATVTPLDLTPPAAPTGLDARPSNGSQVDLTWIAPIDDVGVTGYEIYRDDARIATIGPATSFTDTVLPGTYSYTVRALDAAGNRSDPSGPDSATVDDTSAPSAPTNLAASVANPLQVDLSWEGASDNLAVTGYRVYRDGSLLTTLGPATSYRDDLTTSETHTYVVRAADAAGNVSDPSNSVTADLQAPTVPAGVSADATGPGQVEVTWNAAGDDIGVSGYRVYRDGVPIATAGGTSMTDTSVPPGTYNYSVRALDAAGNRSDESEPAGVTVPDTTAPSAPGNLTATAGLGQVALSWEAASDDVGVSAYEIYREGTLVDTVGAVTSYTDTGLVTGAYRYVVRALDAAGNRSDPSNTATGTVPDRTDPSAPTNLVATDGAGQATLSWNAASDNVGVTGYNLYRDGVLTATLGPVTSHADTGLLPGTYSYEVRAVDAAGNVSQPSNTDSATVTDGQRPTAPGNLTATAVSSSRIDLAWNAATDNVAVTGYEVWRDGALLTTVGAVTTYSDGVLAPSTHTYEVRALDAAGNRSDPSNSATATVTPPDVQTPTAPTQLVASGAPGRVSLSWQASSDDLAVTGYRIFRNGNLLVEIGAVTSYTDTPLAPGSYTYVVRALDGSGHVSDPSQSASATVPDVDKPSAPANLQAQSSGSTQVALTWQASSDNVAVTGYRVYRGTQEIAGVGGTTTSFTDTGRPPGTYSYTVRAADAAGNLSDPSNTAGITLPDVTDPTPPSGLAPTAVTTTRVDLSWQPGSDDVGVAGYNVYRGGNLLASIGNVTSYADTGVTAGNSYSYVVRTRDAAGRLSAPSNTATVTTPTPTELTILPEADAEVNAGAPTTNYATAKLRTDFDGTPEDSFLRFTVSGAASGVQSAKLRVFAYTASVDGPAVYTTTNSWTETGLTWNNRPARTSVATDDKGAVAANSWLEFDVTPFVTGNGTYSFTLAQTTSDGVDIRSREYTTTPADRPQLVVTTR